MSKENFDFSGDLVPIEEKKTPQKARIQPKKKNIESTLGFRDEPQKKKKRRSPPPLPHSHSQKSPQKNKAPTLDFAPEPEKARPVFHPKTPPSPPLEQNHSEKFFLVGAGVLILGLFFIFIFSSSSKESSQENSDSKNISRTEEKDKLAIISERKFYHEKSESTQRIERLQKEVQVLKEPRRILAEGRSALFEFQDLSQDILNTSEENFSSWKNFKQTEKAVSLANDQAIPYSSQETMGKALSRVKEEACAIHQEYIGYGLKLAKLWEKDNKKILAIRLYSILQEKINQTENWELSQELLSSFDDQQRELASHLVALESQLEFPVVLNIPSETKGEMSNILPKLKEQLRFRIQSQGKFPRFISQPPPEENNWLQCAYKEQIWGEHQMHSNNFRELGEKIPKYRILCVLSYWEKGSKIPLWEDVVSSSPYLQISEDPKESFRDRVYLQAQEHFWERLQSWEPNFNRPRKKRESKKVKGSTLAKQSAVDIVYLKNKKILKGIVKKEKDKSILFVIFHQSSRGKVMYADKTISKSSILKIKRMSPEERAFRLNMIKHSKTQKKADQKKIAALDLERVRWDLPGGGNGWTYSSKLFVLYTNTPEEFAKEIAFRTERVFHAYEEYFQPGRNQDSKIKIYVFDSMEQYYIYQKQALGYVVQNPAFYAHGEGINHIVAGCDLSSYRKEVIEVKRLHDKLKEQIAQAEEQIEANKVSIQKQREEITAELDKKLREGEINRVVYNNALRDVRKQINNIYKDIRRQQKYLLDLRGQIRQVNYSNIKLVDRYIDTMISTMFHESFHAFLSNFLFVKSQIDFVPRWLNEGMAQFFENAFFSGKEIIIGKADKNQVKMLKHFLHQRKLVSLSTFLSNKANPFAVHTEEDLEQSFLYYFQSWALVHYLSSTYNLREGNFFSFYLQDIWKGENSVKAFENLVQMPIGEFEKKWHAWLEKYK